MKQVLGIALIVAAVWFGWTTVESIKTPTADPVQPTPPAPPPKPPSPPPKKPKPCPSSLLVPVGYPVLGGPMYNGVEVECDLPVVLRKRNIGGTDGAGLCVFTSIMQAARFQNERRLWDFQEQMSHERGGGWPGKVDAMVEKYGPGTHYLQYEGNDLSILDKAMRAGRMPSVTYFGHDPHYGNMSIAHMVNLVHLDQNYACIEDNNFPKEDDLCWMTRSEFLERWKGNDREAWCVILLAPAPAPIPLSAK